MDPQNLFPQGMQPYPPYQTYYQPPQMMYHQPPPAPQAFMQQRPMGGQPMASQWMVAQNNTPIGYAGPGPQPSATQGHLLPSTPQPNSGAANSPVHGIRRQGKAPPSESEEPTTFANLFVSRLPDGITHTDLLNLFSEYNPKSATVMTDHKTGRSKGFGFIQFNSENDGKNAHQSLHQKHVSVRNINFTLRAFPSKHDANQSVEVSPVLYVRNVPKSVPKAEVERMLESLGSVVFCAMREEPDGLPVWVVLVEYDCQQCADNALSHLRINTTLYPEHRAVIAKYAKPMERKRHDPKPNAVPCPFKNNTSVQAPIPAPTADAFSAPPQNTSSFNITSASAHQASPLPQGEAFQQAQSLLTSPYVFPKSPNLMRPTSALLPPTMTVPATQAILAANWCEELAVPSEITLPGFTSEDDESSPLNTGLSKKAKSVQQPLYRSRTDSRASTSSDVSRAATGFNSGSYSFHSGAPLTTMPSHHPMSQGVPLHVSGHANSQQQGPYFVVVDNGNRHSISMLAELGNSGAGNSLAVNGTLSPTLIQPISSQSIHLGNADLYGPIGRDSDSSGPASRANSFSFSAPPAPGMFGNQPSTSGITSPAIHHYVPTYSAPQPNPMALPQPVHQMSHLYMPTTNLVAQATPNTPAGHNSSSLSGSTHNGNSVSSGIQPLQHIQPELVVPQHQTFYYNHIPQQQQQLQQPIVYSMGGYHPHGSQGLSPLHSHPQ